MNINKYDKVVVNDPRFTSDTLIGTVINTYAVTPDNVAIVHLEATGETVKIPFSNLRKYEPQEKQESKTEIPEGARRITEAEFGKAVIEVTALENHPSGMDEKNPMSSILGGLVGAIVGGKIAKKVFKDNEVITVTRDQLVEIIWNGCSPANADEKNGGNMVVSIAAVMTLQNLVEIFFPSGSENA